MDFQEKCRKIISVIIIVFFFILCLAFALLLLSPAFVGITSLGKSIERDKANAYEQGYIDACKDFYQGKLKYELVENPDGTREWKKIDEHKDMQTM